VNVFAYCAQSFEATARRAAGVVPITSPPVTAYSFEPAWLKGRDLIYFDLHGEPGESVWWGDALETPWRDRTPALTADVLMQSELTGAVVFATNCYLADDDSPMLDALLDAGASFVIGGDGLNFAGTSRTLVGGDLLGYYLRLALDRGHQPLVALAIAKRGVRFSMAARRVLGRSLPHPGPLPQGEGVAHEEALADTLAFRAYYRV
jgi:hypothetical protein